MRQRGTRVWQRCSGRVTVTTRQLCIRLPVANHSYDCASSTTPCHAVQACPHTSAYIECLVRAAGAAPPAHSAVQRIVCRVCQPTMFRQHQRSAGSRLASSAAAPGYAHALRYLRCRHRRKLKCPSQQHRAVCVPGACGEHPCPLIGVPCSLSAAVSMDRPRVMSE